MKSVQTQYTVTNYCAAMKRKEIVVNYDYQRSPQVWPPAAKSFLIETIMLGYPMPKLSLHQITDVKTRQTIQEIVDGQQRSNAIMDFFDDKLRLVKKALPPEAAGKVYSELDQELQKTFLDYPLSVDLFVGATKDDIREVFRRMNSYTVPLNAEEKRHAKYQGDFKWFIYRLTKSYSQALENIGVFTEKQLNRMADSKLFTEIGHAVLHGISTTNESILNKVYEENDKKFPRQDELENRIAKAISALLGWKDLHEGPLMKPYQLYSFVLALMHIQQSLTSLAGDYQSRKRAANDVVLVNLTRLAAAADGSVDKPLASFVTASETKTNVAEQRKSRFKWFCRALTNDMP